MELLKTKRTVIRQVTTDDAFHILELMNSEGWLAYIGNRNINSIEESKNYIIEKYLPFYKTSSLGSYVIQSKLGDFVGTIGLYKRESLSMPDLGFAILPAFYKKGYSYEASIALLNYAKVELKYSEIAAITLKSNIASITLLEKLGFKKSGTYRDEIANELLLCYKCNL